MSEHFTNIIMIEGLMVTLRKTQVITNDKLWKISSILLFCTF